MQCTCSLTNLTSPILLKCTANEIWNPGRFPWVSQGNTCRQKPATCVHNGQECMKHTCIIKVHCISILHILATSPRLSGSPLGTDWIFQSPVQVKKSWYEGKCSTHIFTFFCRTYFGILEEILGSFDAFLWFNFIKVFLGSKR